MTSLFKFPRATQAVTWTGIAIAAQIGSCGCNHVSRWSSSSPSVHAPVADPYDYPPSSERYFHGPGATPLSTVPTLPAPGHTAPAELPAPGHSEPMEYPAPPLPPAPSEGAGLNSSTPTVASKSQPPWALRPMSFLNRKGSRPEPMRPATDPDESIGSTSRNRPAYANGNSVPLPVTNIEPTPLTLRPENRIVPPARTAQSAETDRGISATAAYAGDRPGSVPSLDDSYEGPVITPGAQYTLGRDVPIENWPWTPRPNVNAPAVRLRNPPAQVPVELFEPSVPRQVAIPLPPALSEESSASVPLLLPPGP